jgi:L-seryl-tRNA(Ser) seleniumtransferase
MGLKKDHAKLRQLPGVDIIIQQTEIAELSSRYGHELVTQITRRIIEDIRKNVQDGKTLPSIQQICAEVSGLIKKLTSRSLKKVINATGIIIHTNLGRAPLGEKVMAELKDITIGYSNLEFDLKTASRGERNRHIVFLLKLVTGAEDAVVVNNNAAGIILCLNVLAKDKEVIISRGELIEIGGSFRIPEIMSASGAKMVEVGTTNKTHLSDYTNAVNENTALILKVHKSNYAIKGFAEEVSLSELAKFSHAKGLPVIYDIGSGLLRKPKTLPLQDEPDVKTSIKQGADLVTFSGDKLMGGPQAGIIAGKTEYISLLAKAPLMRALRVGKLTLAALSSVIRGYFDDQGLAQSLPLFSMLEKSDKELKKTAEALSNELNKAGIKAKVKRSTGQCGGGTLPILELNSYAVVLVSNGQSQKDRSQFAEHIYRELANLDYPIIGVLRQGEVLFDVLTLFENDIPYLVSAISTAANKKIIK